MLCIVSFIFLFIYGSMAALTFLRHRKLLDPFIKSNLLIYMGVFLTKPFFWLAGWQLDKLNKGDTPLIPIRSTLGSMISSMSFLVLHGIFFRFALAYYLLKLETEE